jgi:hypothetical protein
MKFRHPGLGRSASQVGDLQSNMVHQGNVEDDGGGGQVRVEDMKERQ